MSVHSSNHAPDRPSALPAASLRISIIVPTRNRPQLLARALEGLAAQTHAELEVIVIDDGSSAASRAGYGALFAALGPRFVLRLVNDADAPPAGPSTTRNLGIAQASGAVIAFCDDDDLWTAPGHAAALAAAFADLPARAMYIGNQQAIGADGSTVKASWLPRLDEHVAGRAAAPHRIGVDVLATAGGFAQLNILAVSKALADAIGGFWTRTSYEEDRDFFWRAADAAEAIVFNPQLVARHNVPDPRARANLSTSFTQTERWLVSALVSQHIALCVRQPAIRRLCAGYEGDILRRLALDCRDRGEPQLALQYARRALAARASFKWLAYTASLALRGLFSARAA